MPEHALWNLSRAFHEAITQKRPDLLNEHLDENIDWAVYGPIDMFPFLGARTGRTAVLEACAQIAEYTRIVGMDREIVHVRKLEPGKR